MLTRGEVAVNCHEKWARRMRVCLVKEGYCWTICAYFVIISCLKAVKLQSRFDLGECVQGTVLACQIASHLDVASCQYKTQRPRRSMQTLTITNIRTHNMCSQLSIRTYTLTHTHMHARTHTHMHTRMHILTPAHMQKHTHTHTHTQRLPLPTYPLNRQVWNYQSLQNKTEQNKNWSKTKRNYFYFDPANTPTHPLPPPHQKKNKTTTTKLM